ncbi:hypothetical protein SCUCBS95973_005754 [Sporothrix curviconia]|uniref:Rab-GAP TBC domain-containing protein n=1 Tax=Sporothrix curviconia TaxID=1260050 RepID=A0ABP0BZI4_9PEZI
MAYQEHDDAAYAGDVEGPAHGDMAAASFRRRQGSRNREFGLFASRLRQNQPPTKRDDAASENEPLRFGEGPSAANGSHQHQQQHPHIHSRDHGSNSTSSSSGKTHGRALLGGSPRTLSHKNKFDFDDSFDDGLDGDSDHDGSTRPPSQLSPLPRSPTSPISPRWASLAGSSASYSYAGSSPNPTVVPASSLHTSIASAGFSTAPTSPVSPTHSTFAAKNSLFRTPSTSSASAPRFAGLSSHPFVPSTIAPGRTSSSTDDSIPSPDRPDISAASKLPSPTALSPSSDLPAAPLPPPAAPSAMIVGNFSRPRQLSIKQGHRDALPAIATRPHVPEPLKLETPVPAATQSTWPRERARGMSVSSNKSSSTYSSVTHRPSTETERSHRLATSSHLKQQQQQQLLQQQQQQQDTSVLSPGLPRPRAAYSRTDSNGSNGSNFAAGPSAAAGHSLLSTQSLSQLRDPPFARGDEESRSSYRSQWTTSTVQKTVFTDSSTARSSVLTKTSSRTSMAWFTNAPGADEGLSVDDVMGLYEKGFGDSTGAEDNDGPYGGTNAKDSGDEDLTDAEAPGGNLTPPGQEEEEEEHEQQVLGSGLIGSQILEAMSDPLPIPSRSTKRVGSPDDTAADTPRPVRYSGLSSSVPKESGLGLVTQHMNNKRLLAPRTEDQDDAKEKRDSAKMLEPDDKPFGKPSPLSSPQLNTSLDSRPGSAKAPSLFARAQNDTGDPSLRDRYGFRKQNQYITREQYDAWNGPYTEYIGRRRRKWVQYLRDSGLITDKPTRFPPPSVKTKRFIRKGIPPEWRGAAWFYYAGGPSIIAKHPGIYNQLLLRATRGEAKEVDIESIERDLHRTFPDNVLFQFTGDQQPGHGDSDNAGASAGGANFDVTKDRPDEPKIVSRLRRVLLAFSIYNPRIGYCQSLNFLAGMLLIFVETEEHCFWLLNVITRIFLPGTHEMSLEGSKVDLSVLMAAMQESLPGVWAKIGGELEDGGTAGYSQGANRDAAKQGTIGRKMKLPKVGGNKSTDAAASGDRLPPITLCMTAWFMSCFIGTLPIETTLRVWDIFFYEGSKTLFRVALAIFKLGESEIRAVADPMEMFGVVQGLPRCLLDANMLMEATFRRRNGFGHLSQESIEEKRRERREAFKEVRSDAAGAADAPKSPAVDDRGAGAESNGQAGEASVRRKGTLFGRRRERRPTEVV